MGWVWEPAASSNAVSPSWAQSSPFWVQAALNSQLHHKPFCASLPGTGRCPGCQQVLALAFQEERSRETVSDPHQTKYPGTLAIPMGCSASPWSPLPHFQHPDSGLLGQGPALAHLHLQQCLLLPRLHLGLRPYPKQPHSSSPCPHPPAQSLFSTSSVPLPLFAGGFTAAVEAEHESSTAELPLPSKVQT